MHIAGKKGFNITTDAKVYALPTDMFLTELKRVGESFSSIAEKKGYRGEAGEAVVGVNDEGIRTYCVATEQSDMTQMREEGAKCAAWALEEKIRTIEMDSSIPEAFIEGFMLRNYVFSAYKTDITEKERPVETIVTDASVRDETVNGVEANHLARDLMNEPSNVLHPVAYAERLQTIFADTGVTVEILAQEHLENLGMGALLAVGQGSKHDSAVVVLRWNGTDEDGIDTALVGKGVTFDTGGVSLKQSKGMEEMKGDMGGSAAVASALYLFAKNKTPKNIVGIVGLVENMPDGGAVRPGDIVTSMSGKTIEVVNTDAEGRLVLADVLWYAQNRFQPAKIIDLATLTGAVIAALGKEYGGLYANDDAIARACVAAGGRVDELVWHLPIHPRFLERMKSRVADLRNISILEKEDAGAGTAAAFLREFIRAGMTWVHIDIAGAAFPSEDNPCASPWPTGFGARLLCEYVTAEDSSAPNEQLLLPRERV